MLHPSDVIFHPHFTNRKRLQIADEKRSLLSGKYL
jgi:hypothetical protein